MFFTDRDIGRFIFPGVLKEGGLQVEVHFDYFAPETPDEMWIADATRRGWVCLSSDENILRNNLARRSVLTNKATLLILVGGSSPADQLAVNFVNTLNAIEKFLSKNAPPLIAKVYRPTPIADVSKGKPGRIEHKFPT